ncbi:hypothetical protein JY97_16640 [Alkalispirochaeta odontotermitis]|nr:hypothetical protein JY97_16640 [Alkalispirochaeta odontotermitis]CAB1078123.1 hypothetical protein D1AOALGA4SA_5888 [Olavius algarvensis Delta 1 endosymbiont]
MPENEFSDEQILKRYTDFYGDERILADGLVPSLRMKLFSLSEFMREIKVNFARFYNRRHYRRGYFWGDRFKYRTRYFTDSGIIGSKEFVSTHYQRFKTLLKSKHEKKPESIKGLKGIYSLKRLSESI